MGYRIAMIAFMAAFYAFYLAKFVLQRRRSIRTNQCGKGDKPRRVIWTERIMSAVNMLQIVLAALSVLFAPLTPVPVLRGLGLGVAAAAVVIFGMATVTMRDSWRVGIPAEKTELITDGIYRWSRNPAFVGFDLLYLAACLVCFNLPLAVISLWAAVMLHLQILQEEAHLRLTFGQPYVTYCRRTRRYL